MKIKHSTTHGSTRKNKRMMSGGKGIISRHTQRFKKQYKRFININGDDKLEKMEVWGKLKGMYKFLQAQKSTYKGVDGKEVNGLEKMKQNIKNSTNSSNTDGYIRAIECFEQDDDTILSGNECVSYEEFVNSSNTPSEDAEAPVAVEQPQEEAETQTQEEEQPQEEEEEPQEEETQEEEAQPQEEETQQEEQQQEEEAPSTAMSGDADVDNLVPPPVVESEGDEVKTEEGGGRARPSRRIKSRKSRKGRMTRRKHRRDRR